MSTIGKVFALLNLALAALFVGWAASASGSNQHYKEKLAEATRLLETESTASKAQIATLSAGNNQLQTEKSKVMSERDEAKNEADRLKKDLDAQQSENAQLRGSVQKIEATLSGIEEARKRLQEEKDKAVVAQRDAEDARTKAQADQSSAEAKATELETALRNAQDQIASLEKAKKSAEDKVKSLDTQIATLVANTGADLSDFENVKDIDSAVLGVSMEVAPGLVLIGAGSKDGVERGHSFEIYSGNTYKGRARVEFVHTDKCSAIITYTAKNQRFEQGDSATTRL